MQRHREVLAAQDPLLKWAGGKRTMVPRLCAHASADRPVYVEPFFGGGALFFAWGYARLNKVIAEANPAVRALYENIQTRVDALVEAYEALQDEADYRDVYNERRTRFNSLPPSTPEASALLLWLNRTCFNGLYRVNKRGQFNVPVGKYKSPGYVSTQALRNASAKLQGTVIFDDFRAAFKHVDHESAVIFCDPPYLPAAQDCFNAYNGDGFTRQDHADLDAFAQWAAGEGAQVLITGWAGGVTQATYVGARKVEEVPVYRSIGRSNRQVTTEAIYIYTQS